MENPMQKNLIKELPNEILLKIFSYLSVLDIRYCVTKVCDRWSALARDTKLWENLPYRTMSKSIRNFYGRSSWYSTLRFLRYSPEVHSVIISGHHSVSEVKDILQTLDKHCPNLRHLEFELDFALTIKFIAGMKKILRNVESLKLPLKSDTQCDIYSFLVKFRNLKRITFVGLNPDSTGLDLLLRCCFLLEEVSAIGFELTVSNFMTICKFKDKLSSLVMKTDFIGEDCLKYLFEFPKLKNVELIDAHPFPSKLHEIGNLECLSRLHLLEAASSPVLTATNLTMFFRNGNFFNLKELKLHQSRLDDHGAVEIRRKCVNLQYLEILTYPRSRSNLTRKALVQFCHCKHLLDFGVYFDNSEETEWLYRRKRYVHHECNIDGDCPLSLNELLDSWDEILIPID